MTGLMCASIVGCEKESQNDPDVSENGNISESEGASGNGELKGEITFSTWGSLDEKKVNEEVIRAFEEKYPGTKINLEFIPEKYREKIDTMFLGGNAPDVIYGHPHYFAAWAEQGLIMDLSERFEAESDFYMSDKFATNMYDSFKYEGKSIATINGHDTFLLYYNKDLFDKAGVEYPTDEWTWDESYLCELDSVVGDGDHGVTMTRGWRAAKEALVDCNGVISEKFAAMGQAMMVNMGGAIGPIFGMLFKTFAKETEGKKTLNLATSALMFHEGLRKVKMTADVKEGQKTLVDALSPAVNSLAESSANGIDLKQAFEIAAECAERGAQATVDMMAKKGRTRFLKEKSLGYRDAGASSMAIIIRSMSDFLNNM
ncbi:dihydroxyacetone kinase subunit DhaL [Parablautia muri]|uniref:dihydroxyacetone kinase subunit DhaL n=1 Tax=Parablautia muri TaxID=2320879 RepID=UPI001371C4F6|nr:dihydroxyacetone kinase subunit DhaL [Parablautia muri]